MNANHSPWMAGTIHRENQAGLDLLLQCDGVHSDRWVELLEDIAWDRRVDSVELTGNLDASEFLAWDTFKAKGEYVQMRRWFSWFKRFRTTETPGGNFLFFFLLHLAPQGRFGSNIQNQSIPSQRALTCHRHPHCLKSSPPTEPLWGSRPLVR